MIGMKHLVYKSVFHQGRRMFIGPYLAEVWDGIEKIRTFGWLLFFFVFDNLYFVYQIF